MVWGAIAAAGIGAVTSIVKGNQQREQADAANKTQSQQVKDQYKRDRKEWKLSYLQAQSDYAWQVANVEAQRYQDRVAKADYEAQQSRVIDAALTNLALNTEALKDQYIVGERLRATQVITELDDNLANERLARDSAMADIALKANQSMMSSMQDIGSSISNIKERGLAAQALLSKKQNEGASLQEQIVISEQLDTLQRDAEYITALVEGADTRAGALARAGGSNSARRVAMDSMKKFGRSYGQLKLEQKKRRAQLGNYNASLSGETANQMAQVATAIEGQANSIFYTKARNMNEMAQLARQGRDANMQYNLNTNSLLRNFNELTVPSFDLAARQGEREYQALLNNTRNTIAGASTPYREAIIFDPLEPIAGLKPEKAQVTKVAKPSWGSILTGAAVNAASGALSMSYTTADGSLGWR